jgi:TonB family protein
MRKETKKESFVYKPEFPGGAKGMTEFLQAHLKYPKRALDEKIEGRVRVKIDIDRYGKVISGKVLVGIGGGCDEEALRVAKNMEFFVPKNNTGGKLTFHKNIDINFKLPAQPTVQVPVQESPPAQPLPGVQQQFVGYTITVTPASPETAPAVDADKPKTITYTVSW